ncbi:MAG: hypothetical protein HQ579_06855 [Candidatus Omnitrophica bacterium]|nr:hypothetical protein [Candidatus Omnitrophota bacterium]
MKKCPKCQKTYDDSWKVCLSCREKLVSAEPGLPAGPSNMQAKENNMRRRPAGVAIFGWLIIIGSVLGLLFSTAGKAINADVSYYLYLIICPLSVAVGIFLLKLKKWARTAIIIISIIVAIETLVTLPYAMGKSREYFDSQLNVQFDEAFNKRLETINQQQGNVPVQLDEARVAEIKQQALDASARVANAMVTILILISLSFNVGVIYYFTRPPVKSAFN